MLLKVSIQTTVYVPNLKKKRKKEKRDPMTQFFVTLNMRVYNNVLF